VAAVGFEAGIGIANDISAEMANESDVFISKDQFTCGVDVIVTF